MAVTEIRVFPRYLGFLMMCYTIVIVLANWFDARLIDIYGIVTDAGTLIFPLTFLLSDLITEVYGYKHARRAIWCGFLFNAVYVLYGLLITHLPSPSDAPYNRAFDELMSINGRIIFASLVSYFCAEPLNSFVMAKLKIKTKGRWMSLRFVLSTVAASALDSTLFSVLAFYAVLSNSALLQLIVSMWLIKVGIEIMGLPLSTRLAQRLKQVEQLDMYDERTAFNVFSLDAAYVARDNHFVS